MAEKKHLDKLELLGVLIGGAGLLYALFKSSAPAASSAGSSVPVLIGSGGDSGGSGLSPVSGSSGATEAPLTIPAIPAPPANSVYAPNTISTIINALANPGGTGCCGQTQSVPYTGVPPAQPIPPPPVNVEADPGYPSVPQLEVGPGVSPFDFGNPLGFG